MFRDFYPLIVRVLGLLICCAVEVGRKYWGRRAQGLAYADGSEYVIGWEWIAAEMRSGGAVSEAEKGLEDIFSALLALSDLRGIACVRNGRLVLEFVQN